MCGGTCHRSHMAKGCMDQETGTCFLGVHHGTWKQQMREVRGQFLYEKDNNFVIFKQFNM